MRKKMFYKTIPSLSVTLQDIEIWGNNRLALLKSISLNNEELLHENFSNFLNNEENAMDSYSHYILRLAFCRNSEYQNWFIFVEGCLLLYKLQRLSSKELQLLMETECDGDVGQLEDPKLLEEPLVSFIQEDFYVIIPFVQALELVKKRNVYIKNGYAYVPLKYVSTVLLQKYKEYLKKELDILQLTFPLHHQEYEKLETIFCSFYKKVLSLNTNNQRTFDSNIQLHFQNVDEIDHLAANYFPLCMQYLHFKLKENNHLKYDGRLQYRRFLKGIGFTLEESMKFWEHHFCKKISKQQFIKKYSYNIKHTYGKVGACQDYRPLSCDTILSKPLPRVGQYHGCPYQSMSPSLLREQLVDMGVHEKHLNRIIAMEKPQLACQFTLESLLEVANVPNNNYVAHPNHWFFYRYQFDH